MKSLAPAEQLCVRIPLIKLCRVKEIWVQVKLGSKFFAFSSQFWLDLAKNLLRVTRVLQNLLRISSGSWKNSLGRVKFRVGFWPDLVMGRAWIFRASGGLGLLCIGPRAGRAFLYRASGFFRAFPKYKMYLYFCFMSMKYEVFLVKFFQLSTRPQIRLEIGRKSAGFWPISCQKNLKTFW